MKTFKKIYVEITNVCNLDCSFCPKTKRKPEFMGLELFEKILKELKNHTRYLYFHVMGEPLLHPDIGVFLDLCYEHGYKVNITTNGTLIKSAKNKLLSKPALRLINFSLHSFDANTLTSAMDNGYLTRIFDFIIQTTSGSEIIFCLRLWNLGENKNQSYVYKYSGKNQYILQRIEKFFRVPYEIKEIPTTGNGIKLADKVYLSQATCFEWPNNKSSDMGNGNRGFCLALRDQVAILVDGTVVPCCLDNEGTINLGNINESCFSELIESKRVMDIYNGFSAGKITEPLCRKCGYRKRFD